MKDFTRELNLWADRIEKSNYNSLQKAEANKPPEGFTPIPGSKKGGFHKRVGNKYQTWYPQHGITEGHIRSDHTLAKHEMSGTGGHGRGHDWSLEEGKAKIFFSNPKGGDAHGSITTYGGSKELGVTEDHFGYEHEGLTTTINPHGSKNKLELFTHHSKAANDGLNALKADMHKPGSVVQYKGKQWVVADEGTTSSAQVEIVEKNNKDNVISIDRSELTHKAKPVDFDKVVAAADKEAGTKRSTESSFGEAMDALHEHIHSDKGISVKMNKKVEDYLKNLISLEESPSKKKKYENALAGSYEDLKWFVDRGNYQMGSDPQLEAALIAHSETRDKPNETVERARKEADDSRKKNYVEGAMLRAVRERKGPKLYTDLI